MKITVMVKAGAKVEEISAGFDELKIKVKAPAREGKANRAVIKLLAAYYKIPQSSIRIIVGVSSSRKIIELPDSE